MSPTDRGDPRLVCPACRVDVARRDDGAHRCPACRRTFPEVAGIPDLRLDSDRYLDLDSDRAMAERLAARDDLSFPELLDEYWRAVPEVPASLAARYAAHAADGIRRGRGWRDQKEARPEPGEVVLDVGCGTGGLVAALAETGARVTGVDVALRWLVVARRYCHELGQSPRLVAADGALLPFPTGSFDRVSCMEVVEHAADQRGVLQSCLLAVRPGGRVTVVVTNRFSVAPEPTVRLTGVGYLPRRLAAPYVRWRRKTRYQFMRPLSATELGALVGPRRDVVIRPAALPVPPATATVPRRVLSTIYARLRTLPLARAVLVRVGPFLEVGGTVTDGPGSGSPTQRAA